jgi:2-polyprenyl-3-methyl-5-hydroxy-6-metoxy-1,4-benzoquinol methylase
VSQVTENLNDAKVNEFYEEMPFNYYGAAEHALTNIKNNPIRSYPDLDALLEGDDVGTVLEIGCGAGWASNSLALHYDKDVTAVDFTEKAIARAKEVSNLLGTQDKINFNHSDLFKFNTAAKFDLVLSIGVLHHTHDCRAAFDHAASFVRPDGFLFVGLYHFYGRRAFLKLFHEIVESQGEEAALAHYRKLVGDDHDDTHVRSWFRDQVLHPQESTHTLESVMDWLEEDSFELVTTSIDRYQQTTDIEKLKTLEQGYEAISEQRNRVENIFFPGFFTVLARRK